MSDEERDKVATNARQRAPRYTTVRMRLRGTVGAVEKLLADLEAAELPWCQVLGAGEALLRRGEAQQHLIVQVRLAEDLEVDEREQYEIDRQRLAEERRRTLPDVR